MGGLIGNVSGNKNGLMPYSFYNNFFSTTNPNGARWYKVFSGEFNGFHGMLIEAYRHKRNSKVNSRRKILMQLDNINATYIVLDGDDANLIGYVVSGSVIDIYLKSSTDENNEHVISNIYSSAINNVKNPQTQYEHEPSGITYL